MPVRRPRILLAMAPALGPRLLDHATARRLHDVAEFDPELIVEDFSAPEAAAALDRAEVLLTFWGAPALDARVLAAAPRLEAVVHAAGSVKHIVTDACWDRGIAVSSAAQANSLPVAEYTVAMVLLANKRVMELREEYRRVRDKPHDWHLRYGHAGNYRRTVGIVGASRIGRRVIELLRPYDLEPVLYDPYVSVAEAAGLGVRKLGLDELCATSDVVSLHAPELPETRRLIDRRRLALMRDGATLINTARGSLVDGAAVTEELVSGRLHAVIDVTDPEVLSADSPLYDLPNVLLTPHVAGSLGNELHRMADSAVDEIARYAAGLPFVHAVRREELRRIA
ncbi:hydroxyacid dehydrogenase [Streptomyces xanthophaeus]|uniref:2-hydroxyacid dehydrogenase n=1 Tax=Streptomyces xanthophaeus TaxID=67385 RepID=A0A919GXD5_9ACTN|nr:hydroxyacid dehydrogenase [Streptomyces xanthophaeus]WST26163.1 hydroxyacid dehydrogenase [Streptomyces xanthophaeus]WST58861.1 hydroxyacid dehydrogenase [Streptomyces xanthophaeus]GHI85694.1 2-hydroxyacid dehydrogenase [Streptomyces xanthophaeus]